MPDDFEPTPQENRLIACAVSGEWWEPEGENPDLNPAHATDWNKNRGLRATLIRKLLLGETVKGAVHKLNGKGLRARGAHIIGPLDLQGERLNHPLWLHNCAINDALILSDAHCRTTSLSGSHLLSGMQAQRATIDGDLYLRLGFTAKGEVNLMGAKITGQLACRSGFFENEKNLALNCDAMTVGADVFLTGGFVAKGEVVFRRANIAGQLACNNGHFENEKGVAFSGDAMTVGADVFLSDGFIAKGEVVLRRARIGGQLSCKNGRFENEGGVALNADTIVIGADIFIRENFIAEGEVNFIGAVVTGDIRCSDASFHCPQGDALDLSYAKIGGGLFLTGLHAKDGGELGMNGRLLLTQTTCSSYRDDESAWPQAGKLIMDGFIYKFFDDCGTNWQTRLEWLNRQPADRLGRASAEIPAQQNVFRPQTWVQCCKVLREMGHEDDARELSMRREFMRAQSINMPRYLKAWLWLLRITIGNGYKPQRALYWSAVFFLAGWAIFATAANMGYMAPRDGDIQSYLASNVGKPLPSQYTRFNAIIFALDNYLPIIELGQDEFWQPADTQTGSRRATTDGWFIETVRLALGHDWSVTGQTKSIAPSETPTMADKIAGFLAWTFRRGLHRAAYWILTIFGWLFVSLFIAGMSGIMKDE